MDIFNSNTEDFLKKELEKKQPEKLFTPEIKLSKWMKEGANFRNLNSGVRMKIIKLNPENKTMQITAYRASKLGETTENTFTFTYSALINLDKNKKIQPL